MVSPKLRVHRETNQHENRNYFDDGPLPWGGSDELWAATALTLDAGHQVVVSVFAWPDMPSKLRELQRRGALILLRPNLRAQDQTSLFSAASSYRDFFKMHPDVVLISQGGTFDTVRSCPDLLEVLYVAPIPFVVVCQWNEDLPELTENERQHGHNFFSLASRVLFVSNQNRMDAERQLARKIPNSALVLNPVNLSDRSYLPWPESSTATFAAQWRVHILPGCLDLIDLFADCLGKIAGNGAIKMGKR